MARGVSPKLFLGSSQTFSSHGTRSAEVPEELNLSRLLEGLAGMNFRERNTNEELLICQERDQYRWYPWLVTAAKEIINADQ